MAARTKFILRFDDVAPGMAWARFLPLKAKLEAMEVRAVLGVVPECRDPYLAVEPAREDFFEIVRRWQKHGDTIAQHGTFHLYDTTDSGLLNLAPRSEFAGHGYEVQLERLRTGKSLLQRQEVWEPYFMAPSHSFDFTTLLALKALGFVAVTDGFGFWPYVFSGLTFVPQLAESPLELGFGYQTLCLHVNTMPEAKLQRILQFIEQHRERFCDFKSVVHEARAEPLIGPIARWATQKGLAALRSVRGAPR